MNCLEEENQLYADNQGAQKLAYILAFHNRKHTDIFHHSICGYGNLMYVGQLKSSQNSPADGE
jgi:hypothetical protein